MSKSTATYSSKTFFKENAKIVLIFILIFIVGMILRSKGTIWDAVNIFLSRMWTLIQFTTGFRGHFMIIKKKYTSHSINLTFAYS